MTADEEMLVRLQERLARERRARRQAEIIAERGMRELWQANNELQERVTTRTAELERAALIVGYRYRARLAMVAQIAAGDSDTSASTGNHGRAQLERILRLVSQTDGPVPESVVDTMSPVDVADEVVERWQHVAARAGLLLSVEVDGDDGPVALDWAAALASLDIVLDGCVRYSSPGGLAVTIATSVDGVSMGVVAGGLRGGHRPGDEPGSALSLGPGHGSFADDLAMAEVIAGWIGASLDVGDSDGATVVDLTVPAADAERD